MVRVRSMQATGGLLARVTAAPRLGRLVQAEVGVAGGDDGGMLTSLLFERLRPRPVRRAEVPPEKATPIHLGRTGTDDKDTTGGNSKAAEPSSRFHRHGDHRLGVPTPD